MEYVSLDTLEVGEELTLPPYLMSADTLQDDPVIIYGMPNYEYHADNALCASTIKQADTPILFDKYMNEGSNKNDTRHFTVGTLLHSLILEPHKATNHVIYDEEALIAEAASLSPNTDAKNIKRTAIWKSLIAPYLNDDGKFRDDVVDAKQYVSALTVARNIRSLPMMKSLINGAKAEVSIFANFGGVNYRCRPDLLKVATEADAVYFGVDAGDIIILSVKTTIDASPVGFGREVRKLKYDLAEAYYHDFITAVAPRLGFGNGKVRTIYLSVEKDKDNIFNGQFLFRKATPQHIQRGRELYQNNLEVINYWREHGANGCGYELLAGSHLLDID